MTAGRRDMSRGLHGGQGYTRRGDGKPHGVNVKAEKKLAQRKAQHEHAIQHATSKNQSCMRANVPGSLNKFNH